MQRHSSSGTLGRGATSFNRIAFGCEQLGGHEWGIVDELAIQHAIEAALEEDVTLFDTADCYGRGQSEERLGRIIAPFKDRAVIATKFGVRFGSDDEVFYDSSPQWTRTALESSLRRLKVSRIDLYQLHHWDGQTPLEDTLDWLETARARGDIRHFGITNHAMDPAWPERYPGLASLSLEYSLANRKHESAALSSAARGLTFLSYGSLGQGVLTGKYGPVTEFPGNDRRKHDRYVNFHGRRLEKNLRIVERLRVHAEELGATVPQLALAWILRRIPTSAPLVGIKSAEQLRDARAALKVRLPDAIVTELDSISADSVALV